MSRFAIDTHALLWFLAGDSRLGTQARKAMEDPSNQLFLSAIALAESLWIVEKLQKDISPEDVIKAIDSDHRISIIPLTQEIVEKAHMLRGISEMHDRQIAATTLRLSEDDDEVTLLTKDSDICASGLVPTIW